MNGIIYCYLIMEWLILPCMGVFLAIIRIFLLDSSQRLPISGLPSCVQYYLFTRTQEAYISA